MRRTVAIVPAGQWGTALAVPIARGGHDVRLWFRSPSSAAAFAQSQQNERRLPGIVLPENVRATSDLAEAVEEADLVVLACSSAGLQAMGSLLRSVLPEEAIVLSLVKAIFPHSPRFASELVARELAGIPMGGGIPGGAAKLDDDRLSRLRQRVAVLSGPNFALEVAKELPAGTTVAAEKEAVATFVQSIVMSERFRVWTSTDVIGVQLGGALKNVLAIGAGISDGLDMGDNARAALVTRGVAEMTRLGVALGAHPLTFAGVSGIGDIMLTCTGNLSRNRTAGLAIGRGTPPATYIEESVPGGMTDSGVETATTVEGIATTRAAHELALELGIDMPITATVYRILYEGLPPLEGIHGLMTRRAKPELLDA